jgi:hypothetical protein
MSPTIVAAVPIVYLGPEHFAELWHKCHMRGAVFEGGRGSASGALAHALSARHAIDAPSRKKTHATGWRLSYSPFFTEGQAMALYRRLTERRFPRKG